MLGGRSENCRGSHAYAGKKSFDHNPLPRTELGSLLYEGAQASTASHLRIEMRQKARAYLTAHAAKQQERQFGWKIFRVTTDYHRRQSMIEALRQLHVPYSIGAAPAP